MLDISISVSNPKLERLVTDNSTLEGSSQTIREFPEIDILVNNLGIYESKGFFDETDEDWKRLFEVNVMRGVRLSRYYLKNMLKNGTGRVIFLASEAASMPYSVTKTMLLGLSRSLAELTKGTKVTVNAIVAGSTETEGVAKFVQDIYPELAFGEAEKKFIKENRSTSLIERLIDPSEIAAFVTYVSSPIASAINGAALRTDGGLVRSVF